MGLLPRLTPISALWFDLVDDDAGCSSSGERSLNDDNCIVLLIVLRPVVPLIMLRVLVLRGPARASEIHVTVIIAQVPATPTAK
jgi:hypothetical protein